MKTRDDAIKVLSLIEDPEVHLDIWSLGLIYEIHIKESNDIKIIMTLTTPMCPFGPMIIEQIKYGLTKEGFVNPEVELTFNPPWKPSDDVRMMLGLS